MLLYIPIPTNYPVMLLNYLKIAWRNLNKNRFYTLINVLGLALATAAFLLIIHYVRFEYSYENFYTHADDIYRVTIDRYKGAEFVVTDCETHYPLGPMMKKDMPEVKDYARLQSMGEFQEIRQGNKVIRINQLYAADPSIFSIFNYRFIDGDPATALSSPFQVVLTESSARKLFGRTDVKGRTLQTQNKVFTISGIIHDLPENTHLKINVLFSYSSLPTTINAVLDSWQGNNTYTYVQLMPHSNLITLNEKLKKLSREKIKENIFTAQPIKDIHLFSHKTFEPETNGDIKTVRFLLVTALLILLIGSVNYINLTTARSSERVRETGMRKALGSSRGMLVGQFMIETVMINLLAMGCALVLINLFLPLYYNLAGRFADTGFFTDPLLWAMIAGLFVLNCLLSGIYPAVVLSGVQPVSVTKRTFTGTVKGVIFRKALVTGQFTAALVVLSASLIVYRQLAYLRSQSIGLHTEQVLEVIGTYNEQDSILQKEAVAFKNRLLQLPQVQQVAVSTAIPGIELNMLSTTTGISQYGSNTGQGYNFYMYGIDAGFIPAMGIKMAAGRNFIAGSTNGGDAVINKEAARLLGFSSPEAAIGGKLSMAFSREKKYSTIVGVTEDYHQQSLKDAMRPMIHWYQESGLFYSIKVKTADMPATVAQIRRVWEQQHPGYPFEYRFLDDLYNQQYKGDQQFGKIVEIFSFFTLFITCLGILGLTAFSITKRTKEIGIRKVLGASAAHITGLLSKDFIYLILIATVISTPLTWVVMNHWLDNFAYRTTISGWIFCASGLLTLLIALITISFQTIRAALANPVQSLKSE